MYEDWKQHVEDWFPTGSRYICSPPVMDTDEDYCVYLDHTSKLNKFDWLKENDFTIIYGYGLHVKFNSLKRGSLNLISVLSKDSFEDWRIATALAKRFNLLKKEDRIALFEGVVNRNRKYPYYIKTAKDWL